MSAPRDPSDRDTWEEEDAIDEEELQYAPPATGPWEPQGEEDAGARSNNW